MGNKQQKYKTASALLNMLPNEVLVCILAHCTSTQLNTLRFVCKHFKELTQVVAKRNKLLQSPGRSQDIISVCWMGSDGAPYDPILEDAHIESVSVNGTLVIFQIFDICTFDWDSRIYDYLACNGSFRIKYSITSKNSLVECKDTFFPAILQATECEDFSLVPAVLVGYKMTSDSKQREVSFAEGKALADKYGIPFFEATVHSIKDTMEINKCLAIECWKCEQHAQVLYGKKKKKKQLIKKVLFL
mmetsp:Transcript_1173/g.1340  ORF Transcript_1173/g.1340 Transcript_1173/m.1340 type:complete len:245 (+) Transcript_1173:68-802(+)